MTIVGNDVAWAAQRNDELYRKSSYGRRQMDYARARTARFDERDEQVAGLQGASGKFASGKFSKEIVMSDNIIAMLEMIDSRLERLEQLLQGGASVGLAGVDETFPAVKLTATVDGGNVYWKVQGGRYMKHGIAIWPEVLETTPWAEANPLQSYDLTGYTAVCVENESGHKKIVALQAASPSTGSGQAGSANGSVNGSAVKAKRAKVGKGLTVGKDAAKFAAEHWLKEAGEAVEAFMFDTAMLKVRPWFEGSDKVQQFRETLFGDWRPAEAGRMAAALVVYADKRQALNGSVSVAESHRAAKVEAMNRFNRP